MGKADDDEAEWKSPDNWHGGALGLYYSPRDSRAFVPKRNNAFGGTINFARPAGVAWLVGLLVFAATLVAIAL